MKVGIQTVMRDTYQPYLIEWLNYHKSIGVDYFFLYDNESIVSLIEAVENIPFKKDIFIHPISGLPSPTIDIQKISYLKFLSDIQSNFLPHCDRVAFIDEDEFIICENGDIKKTLEDYAEFSGIGISWRIFGSSGLSSQTSDSQMKKFTRYTNSTYRANVNIKSIVNPYLVKDTLNPHIFSYTKGFCVDIDKNPIEGSFIMSPIYKKLWINHYFTRSLEEWVEKVERGQADTGQKRDFNMLNDIDTNCMESI